jgi:hypothetical protein
MNSYNIFNHKEIFIFILVMIMGAEKLSPSYAVPINDSQLNTEHLYDYFKRQVDGDAFSNLSRNMTLSSGGGEALHGNLTSTTNSTGPNFTTGDINNNSPLNLGSSGTSDNNIGSGPIFTQHGSYSSSPHMWIHRFH